jgi:hypothetical protein
MPERNRAEGWQHAKLSGHENEDLVTELVMGNPTLQAELLKCANKSGKIIGIAEGGLCEKDVPSVLGDGTKSKPDLKMELNNGDHLNISIKKSWAGQVFLIQPERFIDGFERQYGHCIPNDVKRALLLYFGKAKDTIEIVNQYSHIPAIRKYELHKWRVVKDTMDRYNPALSECLIKWFRENIVEVFDFCFVRGLAKNERDWADVIWYKNLLVGEDDPDTLFDMQNLKEKIYAHRSMVTYGSRNGGSTIQLPFGFLQYHNPPKDYPSQNCMQFHHKFVDIKSLL